MPNFQFKAIDAEGRITSGSSSAQSAANLAAILRGQGMFLMESEARDGASAPVASAVLSPARLLAPATASGISRLRSIGRGVSDKDLFLFTTQLTIMVRTSLPLIEALELLADQTPNPTFRNLILDIGRDVCEGKALSEAFGRHPDIFDKVYISLLAAGEAGGDLDGMLDRLTKYTGFRISFKQKIPSALLYPMMVIGIALCVIAFLILFVLPTFAEVFTQLAIPLPLPTRILMGGSALVREWWYVLLAAAGAAGVTFNIWVRNPGNARRFAEFQLRLPVVGELIRNIVLTRVLRTIGSLLEGGVTILRSLDLSKEAAANPIFHDLLKLVTEEVREGKVLSSSLAQSPHIPRVMIGMIGTGERTGTLPEVITRVSDYYEAETDASIKNLFAVMEPLFIVGLGIVVGGIAASVLLPMFDMARGIQ
jgi:type IV pilus assembly protein PilC